MLLHQRYKNIKYKLKISECDFQYLDLSVVESLVNIFATSKRGNNIPLLWRMIWKLYIYLIKRIHSKIDLGFNCIIVFNIRTPCSNRNWPHTLKEVSQETVTSFFSLHHISGKYCTLYSTVLISQLLLLVTCSFGQDLIYKIYDQHMKYNATVYVTVFDLIDSVFWAMKA